MPTKDAERVGAVDALRGYAIIAVLAVHCSEVARPASDGLLTLAQLGSRGVQLFYIASAFSMFFALAHRPINSLSGLGSFWIRRFGRLAPMFWLAFAIYLPIYGAVPGFWAPDGVGWLEKFLTVTMLHAWWPTAANSIIPGGWSVGVELTFYLLLPLLMLVIRNVWVAAIAFVGICAAAYPSTVLLAKIYAGTAPPYLVDQFATVLSFAAQMPAFAGGILLYFLYQKGARLHWLASLTLLVASFAFMALITNDTSYWFNIRGRDVMFGNLTLFIVALLVVAAAIVLCPRLPINNRVARYVGTVSYSLYLIHFLWIGYVLDTFIVFGYQPGESDFWFIVFTAAVVATGTAAATVTYRLIELPGIALAKRFTSRSGRGDQRAAGPIQAPSDSEADLPKARGRGLNANPAR